VASRGPKPEDERPTTVSKDETVASYLASALPEFGVTHVFELVGGMITVLLDVMHQEPRLTVVSMHHEQGAAFAAEGFARITGHPAVALATSGPGATNLLTAMGSCYFDSTPMVFITGQVNRNELRQHGQGRQNGFQETDIVSMSKPITKWSKTVMNPEEFRDDLARAFRTATSDRPGPVLLDIPMDVQRALIPGPSGPLETGMQQTSTSARSVERSEFLARLKDALHSAERPLILAGGGVRAAGAVTEFRKAVEAWEIPVVTSLMGIDALPSTSALRAGFLGSYGNRWANWAIAEADVLLVLGSRMDVRQTGSDVEGFRKDRLIFHVDVDETELNNHVPGCDVLHDDLASFLPHALPVLKSAATGNTRWLDEITERKNAWPDTDENVPEAGINPNQAVRQLAEAWTDTDAYVTDVGQHQMWAAQSMHLRANQRFLTSGGMGSMGFGLPAAIGAALGARPGTVTLIAGDGGFQCNIQELQTLVRLQLPVRIVIFDNGCHGMVRQFQQSYFDGRYFSTKWGYSAPDFCAVAGAYGLPSWHAEDHDELAIALKEMTALPGGPSLLHLKINEDLNAYPKMAFGRPFGSMEPSVTPTEMEGT
jgi:acetolactate synthase I/II/III large subunit